MPSLWNVWVSMRKVKIISCLITMSIMILIFYFSSQTADDSAGISRGVTQRLVDFIMSFSHASPDAKRKTVKAIHGIIRKAAHFTIYAALGMSVFISVKLLIKKKKTVVFAVATIYCMLYAVSDEIHQLSSTGRSCEIRDMLIDTAGAVTGMLFLLIAIVIIKYIINRRRSVL